MRVLALCSYPPDAAATRFRLLQFGDHLAGRGIDLDARPFLDAETFAHLYDRSALPATARRLSLAALRRAGDLRAVRSADVVLLQREAMLFGPPVVEWLLSVVGRVPIVLDLDDATWVSYTSPTYGRVGGILKWPGKTDWLIRHAAVVTGGNQTIVDHAGALGAAARLVPTIVDPECFVPAGGRPASELPVLGWVGSHSTYPYLFDLFPALERLAGEIPFRLVVVGAGRPVPPIKGAVVEARDWQLAREVADFQSFDVGLYPVADDPWGRGKSGLKAIEYMAVGIPYVVSDVGDIAGIGIPGTTHVVARTPEEWRAALARLLADPSLRRQMGDAGRRHVLGHYTVSKVGDELAAAIVEAAGTRRPAPAALTRGRVSGIRRLVGTFHSQVANTRPARRRGRRLALGAVALLPPALKPAVYRHLFGYRIGKRVRIGLSLLDADECTIGDDVTIGHGNLVLGVKKLTLGDHVRVGHLNVIRGGDEVDIGRYCDILRLNEINSIPDPVVVNPTDPRFLLGAGSVIAAGHKLDFTDRIEIGRRVILGGRHSSLWTHNRQRTAPIRIGEMSYLGSEIRIAPGAVVPARCIVGMGAVVVGELEGEEHLVAGVPARSVGPLGEDDRFLVERKTRDDLPDDV